MTEILNAAYRERAHLVALLATQYPSHIGHNDPATPDWAVVTVELPTGQCCWHIAPEDMDLFAHVELTPFYARGWDGHSAEVKYERIRGPIAAAVADTPEARAAAYRAAYYCPDCDCPRTSLAHATRCLSATVRGDETK
jgi:hypothetical protein